jgi:hypothetical protein
VSTTTTPLRECAMSATLPLGFNAESSTRCVGAETAR